MQNLDISQALAKAGQSQKVNILTQRVQQLEAEITQLRESVNSDCAERSAEGNREKAVLEARIKELVTELAEKQGVEEIALNLIDRNLQQPRRTFTNASIQGMAESLNSQGQLTPIILIPLSNGRYLLFDGERRWRAAQHLGWETLTAVFTEFEDNDRLDDKAVYKQVLSTTLHREDLNALDLAESLIQQIVYEYPDLAEQKESIPKILNTAMSRLERSRKNLELADVRLSPRKAQREWLETAGFKSLEEENIFDVILELQLNPTSVNNNIFPLLKLPQDLKLTSCTRKT